jgi:hypothetical protein
MLAAKNESLSHHSSDAPNFFVFHIQNISLSFCFRCNTVYYKRTDTLVEGQSDRVDLQVKDSNMPNGFVTTPCY